MVFGSLRIVLGSNYYRFPKNLKLLKIETPIIVLIFKGQLFLKNFIMMPCNLL